MLGSGTLKRIIKAQLLAVALLLFSLFSLHANSPKIRLDSLKTVRVWQLAHIVPGSGQVVNKQYWKLPIFYGGMGGLGYLGYKANLDYHCLRGQYNSLTGTEFNEPLKIEMETKRVERNLLYAGAAAFYLASVADAVFVHAKDKHSPTTATVLSTIFPGLGQIYNGNYWKVPVVVGGMASIYYVVDFNNRGYNRFRSAYFIRTDGNTETVDEFDGLLSEEGLKYYVTAYKRNRDLAILGMVAFYALNIIDANVDAHLFNWNVDEKLALRVSPQISPINSFGSSMPKPMLGFNIGLRF